jgi:outer membrane immunogenic protein
MIKNLLAVTVLCLISSGAFATDLPLRTQAPISPAPTFSWGGAYVGGSVGTVNVKSSYTDDPAHYWWNDPGDQYDTNSHSPAAFVNAGYNWQVGQFVFGGEADVGILNATGTAFPYGISYPNSYLKTKIHSLASVRARLGYAFGPALLYVTGGLALSDVTNIILDNPLDIVGVNKNSLNTGWVLGGGIEYELNTNWTVRAEGIYYDFGTKALNFIGTPGSYLEGQTFVNISKESPVVGRIGIDYHF